MIKNILEKLNQKLNEQDLATDKYEYRLGLYDAIQILKRFCWDGDADEANKLFGENYGVDWSYDSKNTGSPFNCAQHPNMHSK